MASVAYDNLKRFVFDTSTNLLSANALGIALVQEKNATITLSAATVADTMSIDFSGSDSTDITQTSGDNYESGGKGLINVTISAGSGISILDADDLTWEVVTINSGGGLLYLSADTLENSIPLAYLDFSINRTSVSGDFKLQFLSNGIITIQ